QERLGERDPLPAGDVRAQPLRRAHRQVAHALGPADPLRRPAFRRGHPRSPDAPRSRVRLPEREAQRSCTATFAARTATATADTTARSPRATVRWPDTRPATISAARTTR